MTIMSMFCVSWWGAGSVCGGRGWGATAEYLVSPGRAEVRVLASSLLKEQLHMSPVIHKDYSPCMRVTRSMKARGSGKKLGFWRVLMYSFQDFLVAILHLQYIYIIYRSIYENDNIIYVYTILMCLKYHGFVTVLSLLMYFHHTF